MSMAEVAKRAGVSAATVCRVLRQSPLVKPETARQVHEAIREIGYVPQPPRTISRRRGSDSSQSRAKNRRIAIITVGQLYRNWLTVPAIANFVAGVTEAGREMEVDVLLDEMPEALELSRLVRRREIDGAVLLVDSPLARTPDGSRAIEMLSKEVPVVWAMGSSVGPLLVDHVAPDNLGIGHLAADYLIKKDCRRVAFVTTSAGWPFIRFRATAFASAIHDAGAELISYVVSDRAADANTIPGRVEVVGTLDEAAAALAKQRPEGVFLPTDEELGQFHPRLAQVGFRTDSARFVSCDNDPNLALLSPRPATIDLNTAEIARRALRRLCLRMKHLSEPPVLIHIPPMLVEPPSEKG